MTTALLFMSVYFVSFLANFSARLSFALRDFYSLTAPDYLSIRLRMRLSERNIVLQEAQHGKEKCILATMLDNFPIFFFAVHIA